MAKFCVDNNCWAILSEDSDFFVFSDVAYVPLSSLDWKAQELKAKCYSKGELAQYLKIDSKVFVPLITITSQRVPLWACLIGNDTTLPNSNLLDFVHQKIGFSIGRLERFKATTLEKLANCVRVIPETQTNMEWLESILSGVKTQEQRKFSFYSNNNRCICGVI
jgi:hypothetical protein